MILGIYGSSGAGRTVREIAETINRWDKLVFIDDTVPKDNYKGMERMPFDYFYKQYGNKQAEIVIALGEPIYKRAVYNKVTSKGYSLANVIHPSAVVSPSAKLGSGIILHIGAVVSADAVIGNNVTLQQYAVVAHDSVIHDHVQISAFSMIAGRCEVGEETYIGIQAAIKDRIKIGEHTLVGMGSVVVKDVDSLVTVSGNPARVIAKRSMEDKVF